MMHLSVLVKFKGNNKIYLGVLDNFCFQLLAETKKMPKNLIKIENEFIRNGINIDYVDKIKKMNNLSSIFILPAKKQEQSKKKNENCLACINKCKQNINVDVVSCKKFKLKKTK